MPDLRELRLGDVIKYYRNYLDTQTPHREAYNLMRGFSDSFDKDKIQAALDEAFKKKVTTQAKGERKEVKQKAGYWGWG